ncbi:hypothetical protein BOO71_0000139 [Deinococcus marmoris]|uniref:Uncharacterized protein n=1 Tax=Deinococcus marmoris TaxID=249408 RepID=A0A1U7P566_9DEIO|nr:hypothetical protein BOO71_0000139 [Deinococcus marmoris]
MSSILPLSIGQPLFQRYISHCAGDHPPFGGAFLQPVVAACTARRFRTVNTVCKFSGIASSLVCCSAWSRIFSPATLPSHTLRKLTPG